MSSEKAILLVLGIVVLVVAVVFLLTGASIWVVKLSSTDQVPAPESSQKLFQERFVYPTPCLG